MQQVRCHHLDYVESGPLDVDSFIEEEEKFVCRLQLQVDVAALQFFSRHGKGVVQKLLPVDSDFTVVDEDVLQGRIEGLWVAEEVARGQSRQL